MLDLFVLPYSIMALIIEDPKIIVAYSSFHKAMKERNYENKNNIFCFVFQEYDKRMCCNCLFGIGFIEN